MANLHEVRAQFDQETIVMYQAYRDEIAKPAIEDQTFAAPFSFHRMTWIKPSFRWLMYRSNWGQKSGQNNILAVHITREGWEKALSLGVLTSPEKKAFKSGLEWETERSLRGAPLDHNSIQVGLSSQIIHEYVEDWIVKIEDFTPQVRKMHSFMKSGDKKNFTKHIPAEKIYPIPKKLKNHLLIE